MEPKQSTIMLPFSVVSPTDVARLAREIEFIDNFFHSAAARTTGKSNAMPRPSKLLELLTTDNQLNLLKETDRSKIATALSQLRKSAPVMHISFSVDPPGSYLQKIVEWLRINVHQHTLLTVGLQPNIGAGCVLRTTNKIFDFSLRQFFAQKRDFFIRELQSAVGDSANVAEAGKTPLTADVESPVSTEPTAAQPLKVQPQ